MDKKKLLIGALVVGGALASVALLFRRNSDGSDNPYVGFGAFGGGGSGYGLGDTSFTPGNAPVAPDKPTSTYPPQTSSGVGEKDTGGLSLGLPEGPGKDSGIFCFVDPCVPTSTPPLPPRDPPKGFFDGGAVRTADGSIATQLSTYLPDSIGRPTVGMYGLTNAAGKDTLIDGK